MLIGTIDYRPCRIHAKLAFSCGLCGCADDLEQGICDDFLLLFSSLSLTVVIIFTNAIDLLLHIFELNDLRKAL